MNKAREGLLTISESKAEGALQLLNILSEHLHVHDRKLRNDLVSLKSDFSKFLKFMRKGD